MFVLTSEKSEALFALSSKFAMSLFFVHTVCGRRWRNVLLSAAAWFGTEAQGISPQRRGLSGSRTDRLMSGRVESMALSSDFHLLP